MCTLLRFKEGVCVSVFGGMCTGGACDHSAMWFTAERVVHLIQHWELQINQYYCIWWDTIFYYRWLFYSPIGEPIAGTKLISFKVPLKDVSNVNFFNFFYPVTSKYCIYKRDFYMVILCNYSFLILLNTTLGFIKVLIFHAEILCGVKVMKNRCL